MISGRMNIKQYLWEKFFDLQIWILIESPESNFANRVYELTYTLQDSFVAIYDVALASFLPLHNEWTLDILEAALQISQSAMT